MENKTGIPASTLGRERNRYAEMRLISGVTEKQVTAQMKIDAQRYAAKLKKTISFADYKTDIETLPTRSNSGKREADKLERDTLIIQTQDVNAVTNTAILSHLKLAKLSDADKVVAFDALGERASVLAVHLNTGFDKFGAMTMTHAPNPHGLLCVHIAGWEDGSKNLRYQYAPRKLPISKRSGYRDDSLVAPVFEIAPVPVKEQ